MSSKKPLEATYLSFIEGVYGKQPHAEDFILPGQTLSAEESLAVYRGSVLGGLTQALGDIYPAVKRCLGEEFFDAMAGRYIQQYPSRSPSLDDYGEHFSAFMQTFSPLSELPFMPDLGIVEWAWHRAFHSANEDILDVDTLQEISQEAQLELCFRVSKSITLVKSDFPISKIWRVNRGFEQAEQIDLADGGEYLIVWRHHYDTRVDVLSELEFSFLTLIKKGLSLGTIYENLLSNGANTQELVATFVSVLSSGWLTGTKN